MSSLNTPRPILKRSPGCYHANNHPPLIPLHHAVHFPPSPSLTCTFDAHSPLMYDRSPISVSPNSCALPERGCPGRTYTLDETQSYFCSKPKTTMSMSRGHVHPRALARQQAEDSYSSYSAGYSIPPPPSLASVPPLVPDFSSSSESSEESDGFISPVPTGSQRQAYGSYPQIPPYDVAGPYMFPGDMPSADYYNTPLAPRFPAYPQPSPYPAHLQPPTLEPIQKPRRRRIRSRERDASRIRGPSDDHDAGYDDDVDVATPTNSTPASEKRRSRRGGYATLCKSFATFGVQDDGSECLGGF